MKQSTIPVLFITFARPDYARQTFDGIKKAKPSKLYFYSNKAREDKPEEIERNNIIRAFIAEIDWVCELKSFFRDEFVDIYTSLWSAIDWIFENEEQAIILEEDCVPSLAFFDFCEQMLPKYYDDFRIWIISGNNFFESYNPNGHDYIFSRFPYQYGWASWRSRWKKMERHNFQWEEMKKYGLNHQLYALSKRKTNYIVKRHEAIINFVHSQPAWDHIFGINMIREGAFGIVPAFNLVSNIGYYGEHNSGVKSLVYNRKTLSADTYSIFNEPPFVVPDYFYDQYFFHNKFYRNSLFYHRIKRKLVRLFGKIF